MNEFRFKIFREPDGFSIVWGDCTIFTEGSYHVIEKSTYDVNLARVQELEAEKESYRFVLLKLAKLNESKYITIEQWQALSNEAHLILESK